MKRLIILLIALASSFLPSMGKSIEIVYGDFSVSTSPTSDEIKAHCVFKNVSDKEIKVKLYINLLEATEGLDVSFCWGPICYPPLSVNSPMEPLDAITLQPGEISRENEFYLTFSPNGYEGEALVQAVLYVQDSPDDSTQVNFRLSSMLGLVENDKNSAIEFVSTNDYIDIQSLDFASGEMRIYDITGALFYTGHTTSILDVSALPNGIYILTQTTPKLKRILINKF